MAERTSAAYFRKIEGDAASDDPITRRLLLEQSVRDNFVLVEAARELKKDIANCYRFSGVDHQPKCRELVQQYWNVVRKIVE
jgi:hypothetical protein